LKRLIAVAGIQDVTAMLKEELKADFSWQRWSSTDADIRSLGARTVSRIVLMLTVIRKFEETVLDLKRDGLIKGPAHACIGQESNAVAMAAALAPGDLMSGSHRAHHHFLARLLAHTLPMSWTPADELPKQASIRVECALAEILGLAPGQCRGRGGSMHLRDASAGFLGSNAIVGGGIPIATGAAFANWQRRSGSVVVSFCGDGAVDQGAFHEACNLSGVWRLPIVHFIENNGYAEATPSKSVTAVPDLSVRAASYGMDGYLVNGNDLLALCLLARHVISSIRAGGVPCLIESKCYRHFHHDGPSVGSEFGYRSRAEEDMWLQSDPHDRFPELAVSQGVLGIEQVKQIRGLAQSMVMRAVDFCLTRDSGVRKVRASLWPPAESVRDGLRSDESELARLPYAEPQELDCPRSKTMLQVIGASISRWLEKDPTVVFLGEGVADYWGVLRRSPPGTRQEFPNQVFNTPISEAGFSGVACGAAATGLQPIIEIMYPDFALVAADQLFNQIGKFRHIYGNTAEMPLVARTKVAIGFGYGGQHSMDPVGLFSLFPGWRIVAPSSAADYIGLFNTAMASRDPVLIIEYLSLYQEEFLVPEHEDYCIPFGKARVVASGSDITLVAYGAMTRNCLRLAAELELLGISLEVIDLRTLDTNSLDIPTVESSARKTGRVLIVEQCAEGQGIGPMLAHRLEKRLFGILCTPIRCLSAQGVPIPASPALERAALLDDREIIAVVTAMVSGNRARRAPLRTPESALVG
jgi:2-oxoisovalerate dehydrogenase E1 component